MVMRNKARRSAERTSKSSKSGTGRGVTDSATKNAIVEAKSVRKEQAVSASTEPTHEAIAARAYELWLERGGNDIVNWLEAENELRQAAAR